MTFDRLCYLSPWIKYEYPNDTTVIEYALAGNGEKDDALECFVPWKSTCHLSQNKRLILDVEFEYFIDTVFWLKNGMTIDSLNNLVEANYNGAEDLGEKPLIISGFVNSLSKLNGVFPVSEDFDLNLFYLSEAQKSELLKALNR